MEKEEAGGEMLEYSIVDEKKVPAEMTERIAGMEETPFQHRGSHICLPISDHVCARRPAVCRTGVWETGNGGICDPG